MEITRNDRVRMERAHVRAWPALKTAEIDGWLWRSSGGGSQRANAVSTIDFTGNDPATSIREVEARFYAQGAPARFQTFDETSPAELTTLLRRLGYTEAEPTITMFKRAEQSSAIGTIEISDRAWPDWRAVYLGEITENRREVNNRIIDLIPAPSAFFGCRRGESIVCTALCVVGFDCAVIECVTTRADARRQGAARSVLQALESWAARQQVNWIGLQVVTTNAPAIKLYEQLGYQPGAINRFWVRHQDG